MKRGFVVIAVPKSGMFLRKGVLYDGAGNPHVTSFHMTVCEKKADANKGKMALQRKWSDKYNFMVVELDYSIRKASK